MTPERINELRRAASIQAGANPDNSVVSALLHAHGTVLGECLDEIKRLRVWLRAIERREDYDDSSDYELATFAQRALNGEEVPK